MAIHPLWMHSCRSCRLEGPCILLFYCTGLGIDGPAPPPRPWTLEPEAWTLELLQQALIKSAVHFAAPNAMWPQGPRTQRHIVQVG